MKSRNLLFIVALSLVTLVTVAEAASATTHQVDDTKFGQCVSASTSNVNGGTAGDTCHEAATYYYQIANQYIGNDREAMCHAMYNAGYSHFLFAEIAMSSYDVPQKAVDTVIRKCPDIWKLRALKLKEAIDKAPQ
jgi:hypothetical protein